MTEKGHDSLPQGSRTFIDLDLNDMLTLDQIHQMRREIIKHNGIGVMWNDNPAFSFGAMENNNLAGMTVVSPEGVVTFLVRPSEQGKGIGKEMMQHAITKAKEMGMERLQASVHQGSVSEHVLQAAGFQLLGDIGEDPEITTTNIYELRLT